MLFDKKLCLGNIYYLAKENGVKIGELEAVCNVSTGYISRLRQEENATQPSIEFIVAAAKRLGVSVDALIYFDYTAATETEKYLQSFLEKVIHDTQEDRIIWQEESVAYLDKIETDDEGESLNPLFENRRTKDSWEIFFNSGYHPKDDTVHPLKSCYHAEIGNEAKLYLLKVFSLNEDPEDDNWEETELYLSRNYRHSTPICHIDHKVKSCLDATISRLYDTVKECSSRPKLLPDVKKAIDAYMKPCIVIQSVAEDVDEEELPF